MDPAELIGLVSNLWTYAGTTHSLTSPLDQTVKFLCGFPTSANQLHPLLDGANGVKQDFFGLT